MFGGSLREAYESLAPQLAALERVSLPRYTLDATHAVAQARGIVRRLEEFRPSLARLPDFDLGHLDRMGELANALVHVHTHLFLFSQKQDRSALAAEARQIRALLMAYVDVLVLNGTVGVVVARRLRRGAGHLDLCSDLTTLSLIFHDRPATLGPGAPVTAEQVRRGYEVGIALGVEAVRGPRDIDREHLLWERAKIALLARGLSGPAAAGDGLPPVQRGGRSSTRPLALPDAGQGQAPQARSGSAERRARLKTNAHRLRRTPPATSRTRPHPATPPPLAQPQPFPATAPTARVTSASPTSSPSLAA